MKYFVTGGAGFIGSHLIDRLVKEKNDVICLVWNDEIDLEDKVNRLNDLGAEVVYADIRDLASVKKVARDVDVVFHLAALARAYEHLGAKDYLETNIHGTRNVLEAFKDLNIKKFVYLSSIEAVGGGIGESLTEESPCKPVGIYGESKRGGEILIKQYHSNFGLPSCTVRIPMIYGPRNILLWPRLFNIVRRGFYPIVGEGETKFEFCFVGNVIEGLIKVADYEKSAGEIFFISNERSYKINEVLNAIAQNMGVRLKIIKMPFIFAYFIAKTFEFLNRFLRFYPFTVPETGRPAFSRNTIRWTTRDKWICSTKKAKEHFDFIPPFSLDEGLKKTVDWYSHLGLFKPNRK